MLRMPECKRLGNNPFIGTWRCAYWLMLPGGRSELVLGVNENAFRLSRELPVTGSLAQFSLRVLIAIALVVCALLIWQLQSVLLLLSLIHI